MRFSTASKSMKLLPAGPSFKPSRLTRNGFSLVEMLAVIVIITLLIAVVAPALIDVIRSSRLTSAGDSLLNRMSLAQQSAVALGTEVEMRFYYYQHPDSDLGKQSFNAYQVVEDSGRGSIRFLSEPYYLESGVYISDNPTFSPILQTRRAQEQNDEQGPEFRQFPDATYAAVRFYPDGSCKVLTSESSDDSAAVQDPNNEAGFVVAPLTKSFLTIMDTTDGNFGDAVPSNYFCIQIDAYTGKARVYRP